MIADELREHAEKPIISAGHTAVLMRRAAAHIEAQDCRIANLERDLLTLALFAYGHETRDMAIETQAVMERMAPKIQAALAGKGE